MASCLCNLPVTFLISCFVIFLFQESQSEGCGKRTYKDWLSGSFQIDTTRKCLSRTNLVFKKVCNQYKCEPKDSGIFTSAISSSNWRFNDDECNQNKLVCNGDCGTDDFICTTGGVEFKPYTDWWLDLCKIHDMCYKLGRPKSNCDDDFYDNMLEQCKQQFPYRVSNPIDGTAYAACLSSASTAIGGVMIDGTTKGGMDKDYCTTGGSSSGSCTDHSSGWSLISGSLKHIDIAYDGTVYGVNSNDYIYKRNTNDNGWITIDGRLKQISVGSSSLIYGVNSNDDIYKRYSNGNGWSKLDGKLKYVDVAKDGTVYGVNSNDYIYKRNTNDNGWIKIDGRLKQISVGSSSHIWGVNNNNDIYKRNSNGNGWIKVNGKLKHVTVSNNGDVWGVNQNDEIYHYNGNGWNKIGGHLKQISVGRDCKLRGVNNGNKIYKWDASSTSNVIPNNMYGIISIFTLLIMVNILFCCTWIVKLMKKKKEILYYDDSEGDILYSYN